MVLLLKVPENTTLPRTVLLKVPQQHWRATRPAPAGAGTARLAACGAAHIAV